MYLKLVIDEIERGGVNGINITININYWSISISTILLLIIILSCRPSMPYKIDLSYILNEDTQPVIRAIGVSHTACKYEFRQDIRSHSWMEECIFIFIIYVVETTVVAITRVHL